MQLLAIFNFATCLLSGVSSASTSRLGPPLEKRSIQVHIRDDNASTTTSRNIFRTTIPSRYDFNRTRTAWESDLPVLNTTYNDLLRAGDTAGALAALQALPPLSTFIDPPRDFGRLLTVLGETSRHEVQYEVGNPWIAVRVAKYAPYGVLYAPWRVLLLEEEVDGRVKFEFDSPVGIWGRFDIREVDALAWELEDKLKGAMMKAAGWGSNGEWEA